ncbi:fasciclin domain-containing protein [Aspergillus niger CBS 101883]|uniref:FAS1 domain-containing protein n=1 Tax=Aspergillus niger ATCC 13496 TaxID=1353008 RepID=A0A370BU28_ASPNG|nr:FAS1 domain-containing protein [Aspergillus niger CBS 101883]PYH57397.1 FAS1 domain-containing protein [Aspergillus niger CBS 101883]RDH16882.1 FAS1 domain-containing protein [Aspergillus niger ATCC 13496]
MKLPLWPLVALPLSAALVFPFYQNHLPKDDHSITIDDENKDSDLINGITTTLATALDHLTTDIWPTIVDNSFNYRSSDCLHHYVQQVSNLAPPFRRPSPPPYLRHPASNKTLYDLILSNPDTSLLAHFIRNDPHLTHLLNNTSANLTFFAPTDAAIHKLHHHHHHHHHGHNTNNNEDAHDRIRHILTYHTVKGSYPIDRLFHSPTIPTHIPTEPNSNSLPQRITVRPIITRNLMLNFHSRVISLDKHASNGVLYHIDSVLLPPPAALTLLDIIPLEFSTFTLALYKTGLDRKGEGGGLTLFLPTNSAFSATFTPQALAFLFSPEGSTYLSAIIKYHFVVGETLYSDTLYTKHGDIVPLPSRDVSHLEMGSLLHGAETLFIDAKRHGAYPFLRVNGYQSIKTMDLLSVEGNMHVLNERVLVPPKRVGDGEKYAVDPREREDGYLMGVEEVRERLGGFLVGG